MGLFSVRSVRQFYERLECDPLFKWFRDLNIMDHSFYRSVFAMNRQRWLAADVAPLPRAGPCRATHPSTVGGLTGVGKG